MTNNIYFPSLSLYSDADAPFAKWDVDHVAGWMHEMGLGRYVAMCRVWIKNGATLLQASPIDLERVSQSTLFLSLSIFLKSTFVVT